MVLNPDLPVAYRDLLGEEPVLFKEKVNFKLPGTRPDKLHQDQAAGWNAYTDFFVTMAVVIDANRRLAAQINKRAAPLAADPRVRHFRNTGMIWAFDVQTDDPLFSRRFHQASLARGLLLRPLGNTVYFMPPYVIGGEEIDLLVSATLAALDAVLP